MKRALLFFNSVLFNICLLLFAVELCVQVAQPVGWVRAWSVTAGWVPRKLPALMTSSRSADVVLTGSSLFLYPAVRCDETLEKRRSRYDRYYVENEIDPYSDARYFCLILGERLGRNLTVVNLATAGSLISDQYLVFRNWIVGRKKPQFIVVDISPREFIDNNLQTFENTPVCKVLRERFSIWQIFQANAAGSGGWAHLLKPTSSFFRDRSEYRMALVNIACRLTGCEPNLFYASNMQASRSREPAGQAPFSKALDPRPIYEFVDGPLEAKSYKDRYTPLNMHMYRTQLHFLEEYLKLANANKVGVILVVMPMRQENSALLPNEFKQLFASDLQRLSRKYDSQLLIPSEEYNFSAGDFEGFAHLNAQGGVKFYQSLVERIFRIVEH